MPRFVLLRHELPNAYDAPRDSHWDLMLEDGATLQTWAICQIPDVGCWVEALSLPPHRTEYLDYEGPVSNNRGEVTQWDHGDFDWLEKNETRVTIRLRGKRIQGEAILEQLSADHGWRFMIAST
ncbi:MAG: DNA polymerase ligase N-terminal domain-containing protein [Pirellulaceae bacterium]|nr:DNA polymerase ligase N-terminal domain-containing protein [Pirellulaceae bacterium]